MKWDRQETYKTVDLDLDEFSRGQLLQALIDDNAISKTEACEILARKSPPPDRAGVNVKSDIEVESDIEVATWHIRNNRKAEALHYLERHLGYDFMGKLS